MIITMHRGCASGEALAQAMSGTSSYPPIRRSAEPLLNFRMADNRSAAAVYCHVSSLRVEFPSGEELCLFVESVTG